MGFLANTRLDRRGEMTYNRLRRFEWRDTILPTDRVIERRALGYSSVYNSSFCVCVARVREEDREPIKSALFILPFTSAGR